jgi:formate/nitrite transporter family protein
MGQFFFNMIPVFLGNAVGGASFVGASYLYTYKDTLKDSTK